MYNKESEINNILSSEIKESFNFDVSDDFTEKVKIKIDYKAFKRNQTKQTALILGILTFFLLSIILIFYVNKSADFSQYLNSQYSLGIWRYKFIPITILSLSLVVIINLMFRKRFKKWEQY